MTDQGVTHYKIKHVKPDVKRHFVNVLVCSKNTEKKKNHLGRVRIYRLLLTGGRADLPMIRGFALASGK